MTVIQCELIVSVHTRNKKQQTGFAVRQALTTDWLSSRVVRIADEYKNDMKNEIVASPFRQISRSFRFVRLVGTRPFKFLKNTTTSSRRSDDDDDDDRNRFFYAIITLNEYTNTHGSHMQPHSCTGQLTSWPIVIEYALTPRLTHVGSHRTYEEFMTLALIVRVLQSMDGFRSNKMKTKKYSAHFEDTQRAEAIGC